MYFYDNKRNDSINIELDSGKIERIKTDDAVKNAIFL